MSIQEFFEKHSLLFIKQKKEWTEIFLDWETRNRYTLLDRDQLEIGAIEEEGSGIMIVLKRWFLRSHRPFQVTVTASQEILLKLSRQFFFFFSDLYIFDQNQQALGSVHRRFAILYKRYDLKNERGELFATIASPLWRLWTFPVLNLRGDQISVITKKWGGILKEAFSDADQFGVYLESSQLSSNEKAIIFAASISIDFDFFENNSKRGGLIFND